MVIKNKLILLLIFIGGCQFSLIGEKDLQKFASITNKQTEDAIKRAPEPFIEGPTVNIIKIVDWQEILAVTVAIGSGIFLRYLQKKRQKNHGTTNN